MQGALGKVKISASWSSWPKDSPKYTQVVISYYLALFTWASARE